MDAKTNASYCFTMNYACPPRPRRRRKQSQNKPNHIQPVVVVGWGPYLTKSVVVVVVGWGLYPTKSSKLFLFFSFLCPSYNHAMQTWTIQKLLNWITGYLTDKGIDSPRLSAELLLSDVLNLKRIELYSNFDKPVTQQQLDQLHILVERAGRHEPIDYLLGKTEFYSLQLKVSPDCMIPRPETELLVDKALDFLRNRNGKQIICDLCTGCGCIAIAIAKNFAEAEIIATDISDSALNIAAENIEVHNLKGRVELLCGDLFDPIETKFSQVMTAWIFIEGLLKGWSSFLNRVLH